MCYNFAMKTTHKNLAFLYIILCVAWFIYGISSSVRLHRLGSIEDMIGGVGIGIGFLVITFLHWKLYKSAFKSTVEKVFIAFSLINMVIIAIFIYLGLTCNQENCLELLIPILGLIVSAFLSVVCGAVSVVYHNKKKLS
jgi:hypothetical protein